MLRGDALIHAAAVQLFMPKQRVHEFTDFAYKHNWLEVKKDARLHWDARGGNKKPAVPRHQQK